MAMTPPNIAGAGSKSNIATANIGRAEEHLRQGVEDNEQLAHASGQRQFGLHIPERLSAYGTGVTSERPEQPNIFFQIGSVAQA